MMSFEQAQRDMRVAYFNGATGAVVSATAWLVAGLVTSVKGTEAGILALVVGGMFIFPLSIVLCKAIGRSGKHSQRNPLGPLAIEGTLWMLLSIPVAVGLGLYNPAWFFPAMLLIIAGRYLTFATLYGLKVYWVFAGALAAAVFPLVALEAPPMSGAYTGALIEYAFGAALFANKADAAP